MRISSSSWATTEDDAERTSICDDAHRRWSKGRLKWLTRHSSRARRPQSICLWPLENTVCGDSVKRLCVFTGSSPGNRPEYVAAAQALGEVLVARDFGLVYGGANIGLMGVLADSVLERGGEVVGVIPKMLVSREVVHNGLSELVLVESMDERKSQMANRSDGFIALPGGLGTLDELFEVLTWTQLGIHSKPCALLNVCGYYDDLIRFLETSVEEGFVKPVYRAALLVAADPRDLLDRLCPWPTPPNTRNPDS